ncbi:MAG TPA: hypothetical protein P5205_03075 [Candidatus Paceibacterota bacterium]|nr:hypothetical protein [Verrucomicrobiota bacterium]HSA09331.1 hypothetical protein [Candidatus Paceibacterota bacterium]
MTDVVFRNFLTHQRDTALRLNAQSDILRLTLGPGPLPQNYIAEFRCKGLVQNRDGSISEGGLFVVGIFFPNDYLRRASTFEVLSWLGPANVFHPNIANHSVCIGRLDPGTDLVTICYQLFEIIAYHRYNTRESDSLNRAACSWARGHKHLFPTDTRPLKRPEASGAGKGGLSCQQ